MRHAMVDLVRDMVATGKPVAAICHGPQLLDFGQRAARQDGDVLAVDRHRREERGGLDVYKPVVEDGNIITPRKPDDVGVR